MDRNAAIPQSASLTHSSQNACPRQAFSKNASLPFTQGGLVIGITGGSGSGKSTLSRALEQKGYLFLDCDVIYHELLRTDKAMLRAIGDRFPGVVEQDVLDRKKLGSIVFQHKASLQDLNAITHGAVKREVLRRLESRPGNAVIDAFGLFEGGLAELCDVTIGVVAPAQLRVERLMQRDGITEAYARSRLAAQPGDNFYHSNCTLVLHNNAASEEAFLAYAFDFLRGQGLSL